MEVSAHRYMFKPRRQSGVRPKFDDFAEKVITFQDTFQEKFGFPPDEDAWDSFFYPPDDTSADVFRYNPIHDLESLFWDGLSMFVLKDVVDPYMRSDDEMDAYHRNIAQKVFWLGSRREGVLRGDIDVFACEDRGGSWLHPKLRKYVQHIENLQCELVVRYGHQERFVDKIGADAAKTLYKRFEEAFSAIAEDPDAQTILLTRYI